MSTTHYLVTSSDRSRQVLLVARDDASADRIYTSLLELEERELIDEFEAFVIAEQAEFSNLTNDSHPALASEMQRLLRISAGTGVEIMQALDEAF